jgi:putative DNA primase/helicase
MAARVTMGKQWPDRSRCPVGSVILISAEDDLADTIRPRLDAAGADVRKVVSLSAISQITENGATSERSFTLADIPALAQALKRQPDCKLVIIDPVSAYLLRTDSHNNAEVRSLLAPLAKLAAEHCVAVVIVTHLNKGAGMSAMQRVTGSVAFIAAARAAYIVARDPHDPTGERRLFLPLKNNLGDDSTGFAYRILDERIKWEESVSITADAALVPDSKDGSRGPKQAERKEAIAWLKELLKPGPLPAKDIFRQAEDAGYSKMTIRRAQRAISIKPSRKGFDGQWVWALPKLATANQVSTPASKNLSILGKPEHLGVFKHKNVVSNNAETAHSTKVFKFLKARTSDTKQKPQVKGSTL